MTIRYGSVCSGVGTCKLASAPLGWECVWFSEIAKFPSAVLAARFPEVPNLGDFTALGAERGPVDALVGGPPCVDDSLAGQRRGMDGATGDLSRKFARLAQALAARWVVWEGVPGSLSVNDGRRWEAFLSDLEDCGYSCAWRVLDLEYFGAPQRRRRVYLVGYSGAAWAAPTAVLFESEGGARTSPSRRPAPQAVADTLGGGGEGRGFPDDPDRMTFGTNVIAERGVAATLRANADSLGGQHGTAALIPFAFNPQAGGKQTSLGYDERADGALVASQVPAVGVVAFDYQFAGSERTELSVDDRSPALGTTRIPAVFAWDRANVTSRTVRSRCDVRAPSPTVHAEPPHVGTVNSLRRVTPLEEERLQGLPDHHTLVPYRGALAKDGPRYAAIGNGWGLPVVRWIFERLDRVDRILTTARDERDDAREGA